MPDLHELFRETGIYHLEWGNFLLIALGLVFIYVAVAWKLEPYVLFPIGLGIILGNLPLNSLTALAAGDPLDPAALQESGILGLTFHFALSFWNILPPLIFLGLGAMNRLWPFFSKPQDAAAGGGSAGWYLRGLLGCPGH